MYKLAAVLMLIAVGPITSPVPAVAQLLPAAPPSNLSSAEVSGFKNVIILAGGMTGGGMTGGGMTGGGMTGGGMTGGGMTGGGMTGGGMTGGGMTGGGMTGGGMTGGGMTGGGMTGGGMTGGGMTGMPGVLPGYADLPINGGVTGDTGAGQSYGTNGPSTSRSRKIHHCVTPSGRCAVDSTFGALRKGDSCGCLLGGPGKIQ